MGLLDGIKKRSTNKRSTNRSVEAWQLLELLRDDLSCAGYSRLSDDPTISAGINKVAELVGQVTWKIMNNTENGDERIKNELSRMIDITPNSWQTRHNFNSYITKIMLTYGNAYVHIITEDGYLRALEPITPDRVQKISTGYGNNYTLLVDGRVVDPSNFCDFCLNPKPEKPYQGEGLKVQLKDIAANLRQANHTTKKFLESKWKPSLIVGVDAMSEAMATPEGRQKIIDSYLSNSEAGRPWIIPSAQMNIQTVKPLTLHDLAIADTVKIDKATAAAVIGLPSFMLGVGSFDVDEYNNFIDTQIKGIVEVIAQELTRKLILSPNWYVKGSVWSLKAWDISEIASVMAAMGDRGWISGNEARDKLDMEPAEGLDVRNVLENYIPIEKTGDQKKLN